MIRQLHRHLDTFALCKGDLSVAGIIFLDRHALQNVSLLGLLFDQPLEFPGVRLCLFLTISKQRGALTGSFISALLIFRTLRLSIFCGIRAILFLRAVRRSGIF